MARTLTPALARAPKKVAATSVWGIYRVIRGYLLFKDSKPIPGM